MIKGEKLRKRREDLGISQEKLAERIGVSEREIRHLESGSIKSPNHDTVRKLAKELKTTEAWIYGYEEEETEDRDSDVKRTVHIVKDTRKDRVFTKLVSRQYIEADPSEQAVARITLHIPEPPEAQ